jgi:hypothetical protein
MASWFAATGVELNYGDPLAGGSGYRFGDVLRISGGGGVAYAMVRDTAAGGIISSDIYGMGGVKLLTSRFPGTAVMPTGPFSVTGGSGSGAKLVLTGPWQKIIGACDCPCCSGCLCQCVTGIHGLDGLGWGGFDDLDWEFTGEGQGKPRGNVEVLFGANPGLTVKVTGTPTANAKLIPNSFEFPASYIGGDFFGVPGWTRFAQPFAIPPELIGAYLQIGPDGNFARFDPYLAHWTCSPNSLRLEILCLPLNFALAGLFDLTVISCHPFMAVGVSNPPNSPLSLTVEVS